jgi:hypothetical protein
MRPWCCAALYREASALPDIVGNVYKLAITGQVAGLVDVDECLINVIGDIKFVPPEGTSPEQVGNSYISYSTALA